ncbi:MAG: hypothetical protein ACRD2X_13325 [Vicinamibacteraceae bacterium]
MALLNSCLLLTAVAVRLVSVPAWAQQVAEPASWREVTTTHIERDFALDRLPPDEGLVAPIADPSLAPESDIADQLEIVRAALLSWTPGHVQDPVQRVRNLLLVAAVPDVFQVDPLERYVPWAVFERLQKDVPRSELVKLLYWVAKHPSEGDDRAVDQLRFLGLAGPADLATTRERVTIYALKLLGRLMKKLAHHGGSPVVPSHTSGRAVRNCTDPA